MFRRTVAPGIEIRQFEMDDAPAVFAKVELHRQYLRKWLPWVDRTHSADEITTFIAGAEAQFAANRGPQSAILVDGRICGSIGCHPIDWDNRSCSIGYWIEPGLQGKGVVTKCCEALLGYLFDNLSLHRVEIRCGTENLRSCAIPQRLGFSREGIAREAEWVSGRWVSLVVWSMLADDWKRR